MMFKMMLMIKHICSCALSREGSSKAFETLKIELEAVVEFGTYMFTVKNQNAFVLFIAEPQLNDTYSSAVI